MVWQCVIKTFFPSGSAVAHANAVVLGSRGDNDGGGVTFGKADGVFVFIVFVVTAQIRLILESSFASAGCGVEVSR